MEGSNEWNEAGNAAIACFPAIGCQLLAFAGENGTGQGKDLRTKSGTQ